MRRLSASRKNISALDNITVDKLVELSSLPNLEAMALSSHQHFIAER